ncbi:MAG: PrsW family glutamic-type intramembrane protease [Cyclobacteriaceae bacterium]
MNILILLVLSLSPGLAIVIFIYFQDKYEYEPWKTLLLSFILGVVGLLISYFLSTVVDSVFQIESQNLLQQAFRAFILVALLEECMKFLILKGIIYNNKNFDEPADGIVYSVMIGMGFATAENIAYVFNGGIDVGILRMFTAVPAHATFAIMMGYFVGKAKFMHLPSQRTLSTSKNHFFNKPRVLLVIGLAIAIIAHGIYDYFLFIAFIPGIWIFSFITLGLALYFSKKAMEEQVAASPFKKDSKNIIE